MTADDRLSDDSDSHGPGAGSPVLVLVHGFADTTATWDPLVTALGDAATAHRWDLPGHGSRAADPTGLDRDDAVAEIAERLRAIGTPVHLVGHSLGGYLAMTLVIRHPELVTSLSLISSGPGFRDPGARMDWNRYMDRIAEKAAMPPATAGLGHQPDSFVMDHVREIDRPVLQVLGSEDRRYSAGAAYLQRVLPDSRMVTVAGAGHHPQATHPTVVADALLTQV
ncbi:alpha/beta fold hydrolase [Pseudonocardia oroxyli]|uniref:Pimeloyl-ACP methyl ester carboxylesterase n=1 Tax=Pseudonocardia oroxyli TaxID=366584 RepID=A0A1G7TLM8_PSEOR|nr:alpha/beta fold hydrolase [Pseudonocardia oroxyli]SDG35914.1 Pimeloyl-ACP methyl ester carboxylesterase [Pseudonocardia oroxyli]